ncbi:hypothetical protein N7488_009182 [Penicillium malachiteum]|nr:hypothetical protein N7488_009182 [Penicillium malachiteum]
MVSQEANTVMEPASKPGDLHDSDEAVRIEPEVDQPYLKDLDLKALNRDANIFKLYDFPIFVA